ncbi:carboxypeptidase-like regulatory domain-containing protein [Echinicola sp. CAU 1574]|uniref:Carboxypeptidase-like regulatory domain-containing protein n=1 Tax=Echinicola arenosa TaxID=2774144 RepID=A0ABR9ARD0_9BACT|nr:carboxypeptidase-like regulatory domain-containing protein [Echinicola arenosa]MBD8491341.1 carboxypeptidase-like regulatory domain-containing protein [Echinicola arenosa]
MKHLKILILIIFCFACKPYQNGKSDICLYEAGIPSVLTLQSNSFSTSDYGIIRGQILNRLDSLPINSAIIDLTEIGIFTDDNGKFSIDLAPDEYDIEFKALGFNSLSKRFDLRNKEIINLKVYLGVSDSWSDFSTDNPRKLKKVIRQQNKERKAKYGN